MSYILEALRKADAERQRGTVPGLNTPTASPLPVREPASPGNGRHLGIAAALLAALALLGLLAWQFGLGKSTAPDAVTLAQAPTVPTVPAPTMPAPAAATAMAPAAPPAPAAATRPVPAPALKAVPVPPSSPTPAKPSAQSPRTVPAPARPSASAAAGVPAKVATATPASGPETRIPTQGELPEDVRGRLPRLAISGASYSENPAHRMLIVGGQIYREGEEPAPGLTLEKIAPKEAILNYQGTRYRLSYP